MLYADNTVVVSQSSEQLRNMIVMIVTVYAAFGLTVSEAKTEIICVRASGVPGGVATFSIETAGQDHKKAHHLYNSGRISNTPRTCPSKQLPKAYP